MPDIATVDPKVEVNTFLMELHPSDAGIPVSASQLAVLAIVATVGMLFAGFASAYLVRHEGTDWFREQLPGILGLNTMLLAVSSVTIEAARSALRRQDSRRVILWIAASAALGVAFLAGQLVAWKQLVARGVYLPSNPYSSFFYMLTAAHGLHLFGGIVALAYLLWRVCRPGSHLGMDALGSCATYWHFMGGVWLFLYLLLLY